ncbi:rhodanese-like domain-containing protein [Saccharothrix algeriensis]|uniref:Rhodanese-related sulfurtransferase n=2 Tax=Saccharothrix algeriensis TaxID=173560 RepID=A0ABS2S4Z4_9PSEU|nr:rhodanese-like domain-containing protein [Saccharothrix algeriensis]MBM7811295.1 rhodanese-related sulfurtransferase [Saccharothrix algeriensis]
MTNTLRFPPADPAVAAARFAAELSSEADPDDVVRDLGAGDTAGFRLVETRGAEAFARARIPGALHLPHWEVDEDATAGWDRDLVYVCYCESAECNAATKGALRLSRLGFRVKRLAGGIRAWQAAGYPVESGPVGDSPVGGGPVGGDRAGGGDGLHGAGCAC